MAKDSETSSGYIKELIDALGRWLRLGQPVDDAALSGLISEKSAMLAESLSFSPAQKSALEQSASADDFLRSVKDILLPKYSNLGKVGFLDAESARAVDALSEGIRAYFERGPSEAGSSEMRSGELARENKELKERIERLYAKYIRTDIPQETEVALREKIEFLQAREKELGDQLDAAAGKIKTLLSCREMIQTMRIKNESLHSRLLYQTRLVQSLTADHPGRRELVSRIDSLLDENRQLKAELKKHSELLWRLKERLPAESWKRAEGLIKENLSLRADLEERDARLEDVFSKPENEQDLAAYVDKLSGDNVHLKNMRETGRCIDDFIRAAGEGDPEKIIETLELENQRLEIVSDAKKEQVEYFAAPLAERPLLKAYEKLRGDYRQIFQENRFKDQLYQNQEDEKNNLLAQVRQRTALIKENQRLQAELTAGARQMNELMRKANMEREALKNEASRMSSKYKETLARNKELTSELARLGEEHKRLLGQLESLFQNRS